MNILAIMVHHNENHLLEAHFEPLSAYEVVLVDNASAQAPDSLPQNWEVITSDNRGIPHARNLALMRDIENKERDAYLLIAPDVVLKDQWEGALIEPLNGNTAAVGFDRFCFRKDYRPLGQHHAYAPEFGDAVMLVDRKALIRVGLFNERFFLHGQDIDWCRRARGMGFDLVVSLGDYVDFQTDQGQPKPSWLKARCDWDNFMLDEQYAFPWHNWGGDFPPYPPSRGGKIDISWFIEKWRNT